MKLKERNISFTEDFQQVIAYLAADRSREEQLKCVRETGNHAPAWLLKAGLLRAIGIPEPKEKAEDFLTFGCYVPFMSISKLRDTMKLMDLLGIDYTYSAEKEICCGAPPLEDSIISIGVPEEEKQKVKAACRDFMQYNWDLGKQAGAKNMIYACQVCAALVRNTFPEDADRHRWVYDVMMDKLEEKTLEITPTVMGYFEGCHRYFPYMGNLDWPRYRKVMGSIKGLTLVDLDNHNCCKQHPERILEEAEKKNLDSILVPCGDGHYFLKKASRGKVEVKNLPEILMQVLGA